MGDPCGSKGAGLDVDDPGPVGCLFSVPGQDHATVARPQAPQKPFNPVDCKTLWPDCWHPLDHSDDVEENRRVARNRGAEVGIRVVDNPTTVGAPRTRSNIVGSASVFNKNKFVGGFKRRG